MRVRELQEAAGDAALLGRWADAALATPGVASYGSSPEWGLAAWRVLGPAGGIPGSTPAWVAEDEGHVAALALAPFAGLGEFVVPLESGWGFACPVVGPDPDGAGWRLLRALLARVAAPGRGVALLGLPRGSGLAAAALGWLRARSGRGVVALESHDEVVADLGHGFEAWWAGRAARFRAERRRLARRAASRGVRAEIAGTGTLAPAEADACFDRACAVEARSWKAAGGESPLAEPTHAAFYRELARAAGARGGLRVAFVVDPDRGDVGYAFGVRLGPVFRGLQLGYDAACADLAPAHLAQEALVRHLAAEGVARYSLGMDLGYKRAWGEPTTRLCAWAGL